MENTEGDRDRERGRQSSGRAFLLDPVLGREFDASSGCEFDPSCGCLTIIVWPSEFDHRGPAEHGR
eukprot:832774-Rhodomonas_salina.1